MKINISLLFCVKINPTEAPIKDGETVATTGELRSFVVADYDLTWDLDVQQELEAEYSERPVFGG